MSSGGFGRGHPCPSPRAPGLQRSHCYTPQSANLSPPKPRRVWGGRRAASGFSSCLMVFVCLSPQRLPVSPLHAWLWPQESPLSPCHRSKYGEAGTRDVATALGCPHSLSRLTAGNPPCHLVFFATRFNLPRAAPSRSHPTAACSAGTGGAQERRRGTSPGIFHPRGPNLPPPWVKLVPCGGVKPPPQCHHSPVPLPR